MQDLNQQRLAKYGTYGNQAIGVAADSTQAFTYRPLPDNLLKPKKTALVLKRLIEFEDPKLLSMDMGKFRRRWHRTKFMTKGSRRGREGKVKYIYGQLSQLAPFNKDAAKAFIVANAVSPHYVEIADDTPLDKKSIVSSKGFHRLLGKKLKKRRGKKFKKHHKGHRKGGNRGHKKGKKHHKKMKKHHRKH